jgi:hypothetical protein
MFDRAKLPMSLNFPGHYVFNSKTRLYSYGIFLRDTLDTGFFSYFCIGLDSLHETTLVSHSVMLVKSNKAELTLKSLNKTEDTNRLFLIINSEVTHTHTIHNKHTTFFQRHAHKRPYNSM